MRVQLSRSFRFEAAHHLPTFPPGHKCRQMHGHSFRVEIRLEGEVDEKRGYLIDYGEIRDACNPIRHQLDHKILNEIPGLENPTAEMLARWIWQQLKPALPLLSAVVIHETEANVCTYTGH